MIHIIYHSCARSVQMHSVSKRKNSTKRQGRNIVRADCSHARFTSSSSTYGSSPQGSPVLCFLLPRNMEKIQPPKNKVRDWKCRKLQLFVEYLADIRCWTWLQKLYYILLSFKPRIYCREKFIFLVLLAAYLYTRSPRLPVSSVNAFVYLVGPETPMDCRSCRTELLNKSNAGGLQRPPFSQYNIQNPSWKEVGMFIWTWGGCRGNPLNPPVYCLCCILAH